MRSMRLMVMRRGLMAFFVPELMRLWQTKVWLTLETLFTTHSKARILQLRFQLQTLKKGNLSIHDYMLRMKSLTETIVSAGQQISDDELILYILGGLGHDYDSVVVNLTSRHDQVTLQEVQYMLQSQEMRLEQLNSPLASENLTPSANFATQFRKSLNLQSFNGYPSNSPGRNYTPGRGRGRGRWNRSNRLPLCQLCNRSGHIALKCYHRFDIAYQGQNNSSQGFRPPLPNPHGSHDNQQAYYSSSNASTSDNAWYLDSGATNHITADPSNLHSKTDYKGNSHLLIGNGQSLPITHLGSSVLHNFNTHTSLILNNILCVPQIAKNLLSIAKLTTDNPVFVEFHHNCCIVKDRYTRRELLRGTLCDGLYQLRIHQILPALHTSQSVFNYVNFPAKSFSLQSSIQSLFAQSSSAIPKLDLWHMRLGHPNLNDSNNSSCSADTGSTQLHSEGTPLIPLHSSPSASQCPPTPPVPQHISPQPQPITTVQTTNPPSHPMITRSKLGIFKPKTYMASILRNPPSSANVVSTPDSSQQVRSIISHLQTLFALKTLGSVTYFLGFETTRGADGIHLSQTKYTLDLLKKTNMLEAHPCPTPMNHSNKLHLQDSDPFEHGTESSQVNKDSVHGPSSESDPLDQPRTAMLGGHLAMVWYGR
ncbi:hypothetical protein DKX38_009296 [Salix brachista]|uniref:Retrovirus-related Pol polyprotein from transposon TNT 1-94-like beta-barrel domain-containing protein n=1 Tax=Salix brachista TaxID=2182728 RepID=A0A5N5MA44_9ROSI|nr:hypothetical protein DKX38_009296 [Salix brachista]